MVAMPCTRISSLGAIPIILSLSLLMLLPAQCNAALQNTHAYQEYVGLELELEHKLGHRGPKASGSWHFIGKS